ncbi:MAG: alkaline phosphatase [Sandaracinaceae bacterium]
MLTRRSVIQLGALSLAGVGCETDPVAPDPFRSGVASADPTPSSLVLWTKLSGHLDDRSVTVLVALDPTLERVVWTGQVVARRMDDHSASLRVDGLDAGTIYFYAFEVDGHRSPIGRARTAPAEATRLRIASLSCASYAHGYFHVYRELADDEDLDAILHLGDYVYEYGDGQYGDLRALIPPHEVFTLDDYRQRYAFYRADPALRDLHAAHAWIVTWDDHELSNNAWHDGAPGHDSSVSGPFNARAVAAQRAHREWLPRDPDSLSLHRTISLGPLADVFVLDVRFEGRNAPPADDAASAALAGRTLLGDAQRAFLLDGLRSSTARWKIIATSVQLSPHPEFWNFDAWDGYPADRTALLEAIERDGIEGVIVLTGDGHKSFADDLPLDPLGDAYDPDTGEGSLAVELMTPAVTSPNLFGDAARRFEDTVRAGAPHTKLIEAESRGYWTLELDADVALATLHFMDGVEDPEPRASRVVARFEVRHGQPHLRRLD